jgi:hypothetical protein
LVHDVQEEFSNAFPFLKLEFFKNKKLTGRVITPAGNTRIGSYQRSIAGGIIEIDPQMKVADLEKTFSEQFKLYVQVFRRSGSLWLQTTMTDNWTLEKQNEHGRALSHPLETPRDY